AERSTTTTVSLPLGTKTSWCAWTERASATSVTSRPTSAAASTSRTTAVRRMVVRSGPSPTSGIAFGLRTVSAPVATVRARRDQLADTCRELGRVAVVRARRCPRELACIDGELVRAARAQLPRKQLQRASPLRGDVDACVLHLREGVLERGQPSLPPRKERSQRGAAPRPRSEESRASGE